MQCAVHRMNTRGRRGMQPRNAESATFVQPNAAEGASPRACQLEDGRCERQHEPALARIVASRGLCRRAPPQSSAASATSPRRDGEGIVSASRQSTRLYTSPASRPQAEVCRPGAADALSGRRPGSAHALSAAALARSSAEAAREEPRRPAVSTERREASRRSPGAPSCSPPPKNAAWSGQLFARLSVPQEPSPSQSSPLSVRREQPRL